MTPKEQANELYELMFYKLNDYNAICLDIESKDECAKQCALVAVNEILDLLDDMSGVEFFYIYFYREVKQEIEQL